MPRIITPSSLTCVIISPVENENEDDTESRYACRCPLAPVCSRSHGPFREVERAEGSFLYLQGEPATHVYYLKEGTVSLHRRLTTKGALGTTRLLCRGGTFLGMEALREKSEYWDSVQAETPLVLCVARRDRISDMSPDGSVNGRVASWLLGRHQMGETTKIPRSVLAELLGMHPGSVSRALKKLNDLGLIESSSTSLTIADVNGLQKFVMDEFSLCA